MPAKKTKPAAEAATTEAPAVVEKPKMEVDALGSRVGTKKAAANAVLTKEPQSMKEIMTKAGLSDTCYNHLNDLVAKGKILKTDAGRYRLL